MISLFFITDLHFIDSPRYLGFTESDLSDLTEEKEMGDEDDDEEVLLIIMNFS